MTADLPSLVPPALTRRHPDADRFEAALAADGCVRVATGTHASVFAHAQWPGAIIRVGGDASWLSFHAHVRAQDAAGRRNPHFPAFGLVFEPAPGIFACVTERLRKAAIEDEAAVVDPMLYWLAYRAGETRVARVMDRRTAAERHAALAVFEARWPSMGDALAGLAAARGGWRWDIKLKNVMWRDAEMPIPVIIDPFAR